VTVTIHPITPEFAAEVGDADLSQSLPADDLAAIDQAFWKYAVLVFPGQSLTAEQHSAFANHFGPLELNNADSQKRVGPSFTDVSNMDGNGNLRKAEDPRRLLQRGNQLWHADRSYKQLPALCSVLHVRSIAPVGGITEYADERAAYDALAPEIQRRLEGLVAEHSTLTSRGRLGITQFDEADRVRNAPVPQALVRTLPQSGRKSLYLASYAGGIRGMPAEEGRAMIDQLMAHATQRQFVYTHRWRVNDVVMWDNRCVVHRGMIYDDLRYPRDLRRATVLDIANSCEQEGLAISAAEPSRSFASS
jgi:alpha-ketoglutarate-dependent 2,4-dichlorophenoxyacetate dioxygenase